MTVTDKLAAGAEPWDTGKLGREEQFAKRVGADKEAAVDDALGLQMISIRLQKALIDDLKFIAKANGVGYQPLIRDILSRFVVHETKAIIREVKARREREESERLEKERADKERVEIEAQKAREACGDRQLAA